MATRPLAQQFLQMIAEISRRSDVVVRQQAGPFRPLSSRWEKVLPAEMYAFFKELNGQSFHYSFEGEEVWHGFNLQTLGEDGTSTVVPATGRNGPSRRPAGQLPQHFLQPGQVPDDQPVLLFYGSDDSAGVLLVGEGEQATLRTWNNDGFTEPLPGGFTGLVERLLDAGFAHTCLVKDHPETAAVKARLATPVPARKSFELKVDELSEVAERDFVRQRCEEWKKPMLAKVAGALGIKGASKLDAQALVAEVVAALTGEPLTAKTAKAVMAAAGRGSATNLEQFRDWFGLGAGTLTRATLTLTYLPQSIPLQAETTTLIRALLEIDGLHFAEGFTGDLEVLRSMYPAKHDTRWWPFLSCEGGSLKGAKAKTATYEVVLRPQHAQGLEKGRTYVSTALPAVETRIG